MYFPKSFLPVAFVVGILLGCSSVESVKTSEQTSKIDDLYVVIDPGASFKDFGNAVKDGLSKKFQAAGVIAEITVPTGLELDTDSIKSKIAAHKYLLTVVLTEGTINPGLFSSQSSGVYDLNIYVVSTNRNIWRATIKLQGMAYGTGPESFVNKAIDALVKDGLMDAPPSAPGKT